MKHDEIEAIVGGYHGDPFHILGPHAVAPGRAKTWEVRAFLPQAESVEIVADGVSTPMSRQHRQGFFVASLKGKPASYRLRLALWNGTALEIDDPYRFPPLLPDFDLHLHAEGTNYESYRSLGAHLTTCEGVAGVRFAVWAPNAEVVTLVGEFNDWDTRRHPMRLRSSGVWELFIPGLGPGAAYKYFVRSRFHGYQQLKADPFAFACEVPPKSASLVADLDSYQWGEIGRASCRERVCQYV
jgi:1,4-alpha-glucan branching enzyme